MRRKERGEGGGERINLHEIVKRDVAIKEEPREMRGHREKKEEMTKPQSSTSFKNRISNIQF